MDSFKRKMIADRIRAMDQAKLDLYLDSVIEDFTVEQLKHAAWYVGTKLEDKLREDEARGLAGDPDEEN